MVFFCFRKAPKIRKLQFDPCGIRFFDKCISLLFRNVFLYCCCGGRRNVFLYCFGPPVANGISFDTGPTTYLVYSGFRLCCLYLKQRAAFFRCGEATKTRKLQFGLYECLLSYPRSTASVEISETFMKCCLLPAAPTSKATVWYFSFQGNIRYQRGVLHCILIQNWVNQKKNAFGSNSMRITSFE